MMLRRTGWASLALAGALSLSFAQAARAQDQTTTTRDQTTTTTTETQSYDSSNWQAPRGYEEAFPENGAPNMVARQGYSAGFNEGVAAASRGKKFEPADDKSYEKAIIPKGMNKDEFKQQYREAFMKGYTNGYRGENH